MTDTPQTISIALIGAGVIGPRHAEAIQRCSRTELACIVDRNPGARKVAELYQVPLLTSIAELVSSPVAKVISAAAICTSTASHVPIAQELLEALSVPLFIEKPLAGSAAECRKLLNAQVPILVGHHRRFSPWVAEAKRVLAAGDLGGIVAMSGLWTTKKPDSYFSIDWRTSRAEGGGPIAINLIHDIDCLQHLLGPIVRVTAEKTIAIRKTRPGQDDADTVEEGAAVLLRFASGVVGTFVLSDAVASGHSFEGGTGENPLIARSGKDFWRIFGSEGSLSIPDMKLSRFKVVADTERGWNCPIADEVLPVDEGTVPFYAQMSHFADVVSGHQAPLCTVEEAVRSVAVCDAVIQSMDTGLPVEIPVDKKQI